MSEENAAKDREIAALKAHIEEIEAARDSASPAIAIAPPDGTVLCSFCDKSQHDVTKLIAGPRGYFICNECVELCMRIVGGRLAAKDEIAEPSPERPAGKAAKPDVLVMIADLIAESKCFAFGGHVFNWPREPTFDPKDVETLIGWLQDFAKEHRKHHKPPRDKKAKEIEPAKPVQVLLKVSRAYLQAINYRLAARDEPQKLRWRDGAYRLFQRAGLNDDWSVLLPGEVDPVALGGQLGVK